MRNTDIALIDSCARYLFCFVFFVCFFLRQFKRGIPESGNEFPIEYVLHMYTL